MCVCLCVGFLWLLREVRIGDYDALIAGESQVPLTGWTFCA